MLDMQAAHCSILRVNLVAEFPQQRLQLIKAAMYVTDDIKWPVLLLEVVPQWLSLDLDGLNLLW